MQFKSTVQNKCLLFTTPCYPITIRFAWFLKSIFETFMCIMLQLYLKYKPFGLLRKLNCSVLWMCCCTANNFCLNPRFLAPDSKVHTRCCTPPLYCAKCFLRQGDSTGWRSWTASENIQHADVAYLGVASQHGGQDKPVSYTHLTLPTKIGV